jgi:tRNA 2-thiocytidine biosynthesis protein TtcA
MTDPAADTILDHPRAPAPAAAATAGEGLSRGVAAVQKKIRRLAGRAIQDFGMIADGDLVMACLSGGADSYTMLDTLLYLRHVAPIKFDVVAVNLDQKQPGFPEDVLPAYLAQRGVPWRIVEQDTYSIVKAKIPEGKTTCSLCSRLRRGILYRTATELGATKIALGHHRDDILETLLLNLFFGGTLKTMPPKLRSDDGKHVVIRPLAYCKEADIKRYSAGMKFPIIPCNLCGSQPNLQRAAMKQMLQQWDREHPQRLRSMFAALGNVKPSHLLDHAMYDFDAFQRRVGMTPAVAAGAAAEEGDLLFDRDDTIDRFQRTITIE